MAPKEIVDRVRCPACGARLAEAPADGGLRCPADHRYALRDGYYDLSGGGSGSAPEGASAEGMAAEGMAAEGSTARTFASFGYEWNEFDQIRAEDERFAATYFRDLDLRTLEGKVGLDAGCGKGRFTRYLAEHLQAVAALDGSTAVQAAARNLGSAGNVMVVKSDLRTAPFEPGSFDFISSLGVLHHLDDPHEGFTRLLELLAPGGRILVYLYSRPASLCVRSVALACAAAVRAVTVRLPLRVVRALSTPIAAVLYAGLVAPARAAQRRGSHRLDGLPMGSYRDKPFRSLEADTFDRLSAPVEHRYVWGDIEGWFSGAGLVVDAARDEAGWFVLAHKP